MVNYSSWSWDESEKRIQDEHLPFEWKLKEDSGEKTVFETGRMELWHQGKTFEQIWDEDTETELENGNASTYNDNIIIYDQEERKSYQTIIEVYELGEGVYKAELTFNGVETKKAEELLNR